MTGHDRSQSRHAGDRCRVGRRTTRGFSWFAEVRNIADRHYAATTGVIADARGLDARQFLPGEVRAFYAGIERRW